MTAAELLDVAEVERLALQPGDYVVLKCEQRLSEAEFAELHDRIKEALPTGTKVLILEGGLDISMIRAYDDLIIPGDRIRDQALDHEAGCRAFIQAEPHPEHHWDSMDPSEDRSLRCPGWPLTDGRR